MSDTFEQRLLAYLDGMLDARSRHAFLAEVSRDPAKQKLLDQYRQLDARLRDHGNPVAVPLRVQQALAQRIPSLRDAVPSTPLPPANAGGTGSAAAGRVVSALLGSGRRILGLAIIGGMLAVGVSIVALTDSSELADDRTTVAPGMSTESLPSAAASQGASYRETAPGVTAGEGVTGDGTSPGDGGEYHTTSSGSDIAHASGRRLVTGHQPDAALRQTTDREDHGSVRTDGIAASPSVLRASSVSAAEREVATGSANVPATQMFDDGHPMFFLTPTAGTDQTPGDLRGLPYPTLPSLFAGRLHVYLETGATPFTSAGGGKAETLPVSGMYLAGLRYRFGDHFSAGVDVGQSRFARERLSARSTSIGDPGGGVIVVIDRERTSALHPWLRFHGVYTFNPESRLRVEADAGSGILLGEGNPVMLSSGVSLVYVMSTALQLRAGLHGSGAWMSPGTPYLPPVSGSDGVIGIIRRADAADRIFTSSLDFRIGFGIYLW